MSDRKQGAGEVLNEFERDIGTLLPVFLTFMGIR